MCFCEKFQVPETEVFKSNLFLQYKDLSLTERNKLMKAHILRFSMNTLKKCHANFSKFAQYCNGQIFPINLGKLNGFLMTCGEDGKSFIVINDYVNSIKCMTKFLNYEFPNDTLIRPMLNFMKKFCDKKSTRLRYGYQKKDLLKLQRRITRQGGLEKLSKVRLRSYMLLVFCYCTMSRFDCASRVKLENLEFFKDYVKIKISKSKTDQSGDGQDVFLVNLPELNVVKLLANYLFIFDMGQSDVLFPPLEWEPNSKIWIPVGSRALSYSAAYSGFKSLLEHFGIESTGFSLHSPRIGATTDALQNGTPGYVIDKRGRWRDPTTKFIYAKDSEADLVNVILRHA